MSSSLKYEPTNLRRNGYESTRTPKTAPEPPQIISPSSIALDSPLADLLPESLISLLLPNNSTCHSTTCIRSLTLIPLHNLAKRRAFAAAPVKLWRLRILLAASGFHLRYDQDFLANYNKTIERQLANSSLSITTLTDPKFFQETVQNHLPKSRQEALSSRDITSLRDLCLFAKSDLELIFNISDKTIAKIASLLAELNLSLLPRTLHLTPEFIK